MCLINLPFLNLVAVLVKDSDMLSSSCFPLESGSKDKAELVLLFLELLEADSLSLSVEFFSSCTEVDFISGCTGVDFFSAWTGVDFIPGALISDLTGVDFSLCLWFWNQIWTCLDSSPIELPISCLVLKSGKLVSSYSSLSTIFCFSVKYLYVVILCFLNSVSVLVKDSDILSSSCSLLESGS